MFSVGFVRRSSVAYERHDVVCTEKEEEEEEARRAKEAEIRTFTAILKVKVTEEEKKKKKREIKPDEQLRQSDLWGKKSVPRGRPEGPGWGSISQPSLSHPRWREEKEDQEVVEAIPICLSLPQQPPSSSQEGHWVLAALSWARDIWDSLH